MATVGELRGPIGPFLLEVLLTNPAMPGERRWQLQQSVATLDEGLAVASRMSQAYQYRLYVSPDVGYLRLEWGEEDAEGMCSPKWVA